MPDIMELFKRIAAKKRDDAGPPTHILCGLGNPGEKYVFTRHNAGFLAMDYLSEKLGVSLKTLKFRALTGIATIGGHRVLLMKPQTYMNLSGEAVGAAASYYKIPPENVIVISDDVHQEPGRLRIRRGGSDGGQKGLRSIIAALGTDQFPRIRIGVGEKTDPEYDMADWVLSKIPKADQDRFFSVLGCVYDAVPLLLDGEIDLAMSRFNGVQF